MASVLDAAAAGAHRPPPVPVITGTPAAGPVALPTEVAQPANTGRSVSLLDPGGLGGGAAPKTLLGQ